jgi:hypothetical protein
MGCLLKTLFVRSKNPFRACCLYFHPYIFLAIFIVVRFQKGNNKPTRYRKKYGEKMMPFSEQVGKGNDNIMPLVCIEGKNFKF